jgi:hypothetical protein
MDINKIFSSFTSEDDDITVIDFSEHPTYLLGMFKKLILNHKNFFIKNLIFLLKSNQEIDHDDIKSLGDMMIYNRAFSYIEKIDLSNAAHIQVVENNYTPQLIVSLDSAISYFENMEEYEKCAHILKIKKIFAEKIK